MKTTKNATADQVASMNTSRIAARAVLAVLVGTVTVSATQLLVAGLGRSLAILPERGVWPSAGAALVYLQAQGFLASFLGALVAASIAAIRPGAHVAVCGVLWAGLNVALLWFGPGTAWALSARVTAMVLIPPALYLGLLVARRLRSSTTARADVAAA